MQTAVHFFEQPILGIIKHQQPKLRITKRDLEIIEFLLEMKFATVEDLHFRFFKITRDGGTSESVWWARERLQYLRKYDLLQATTLLTDRRNYFLPSQKGYRLLSRKFPEKEFPRPLSKIELNSFEHDSLVLKMRLYLESNGLIKSWTSERRLQIGREIKAFTHRDHVPDGVYARLDDIEVIFELEISLKAKARYQSKIKRYLQEIRGQKDNPKQRKVLFVCTKPGVAELLRNETRLYGDIFQVQTTEEFFKTHEIKPQGIKL